MESCFINVKVKNPSENKEWLKFLDALKKEKKYLIIGSGDKIEFIELK